MNHLIFQMLQHLLLMMLDEGGADGVAAEVSVVAAATSTLLGDIPGSF